MLAKRSGPDYNEFLTKKTKKNHNPSLYSNIYIPKNDGFNMSMLHLGKSNYLFALRVLGTTSAYKGKKVIPGNFSGKKEAICKKVGEFICSRIDFGQNFFWGDWNANFNDNTILFVGKLSGKDSLTIIPNTNITPYVFSNIILDGIPYKYSDVRLFSANGKLYCYDGYITTIYEINITTAKLNVKKAYNGLCKNIKTFDKNWAYVSVVKRNKQQYFMFLNWFENNTLTASYINLQTPGECIKEPLIIMKRDIISGLGNKVLPMFSFGTPAFELKKGKLWFGVGHTKVMTTMKYQNQKIIDFKFAINNTLRSSGNYIQHNSYYYLVYFYMLELIDNTSIPGKYKMMFSDSYLYYFPDQEYTFSINFPMGIDIRGDSMYISLGVGDYYNFIIKESLSYIKGLCHHNLEDFDASTYDFKLRAPAHIHSNNTKKAKTLLKL